MNKWLLTLLFPGGLLVAFLIYIITASRHIKMRVISQSMMGLTGVAETDIALEGLVLIDGEVWRAISDEAISCGTRVCVKAVEGVLLKVVAIDR